MQNILVTGGAGFIGSHLVDTLLDNGAKVVVLDLLSYAADLRNLSTAMASDKCVFIKGNICDTDLVFNLLLTHEIDTVFHLAAESHVDNSIANPGKFIQTNINGTYSMLTACLSHIEENIKQNTFRFIHVSTDEVFGQLQLDDPAFDENTAYKPNSPYSASKAASDHLVRAWYHTYKFPAIITNCSNNFGPRQHMEKLIPKIINQTLNEQSITIYGTGRNIRDWLYVKDHCNGLILAAKHGRIGESYCFGGKAELQNLDIAHMICHMLDTIQPSINGPHAQKITKVQDRKGHDFRYAINPAKAIQELGWKYCSNFQDLLYDTVKYYCSLHATTNSAHV